MHHESDFHCLEGDHWVIVDQTKHENITVKFAQDHLANVGAAQGAGFVFWLAPV